MRKYFLSAATALVLGLVGCGAKTTINTNPLTDEEKAKVKIEDEETRQAESQGSAGKGPKGKR